MYVSSAVVVLRGTRGLWVSAGGCKGDGPGVAV